MKKVLSVFLAALMLFTCFGVMAYAEEPSTSKTVIITFKYLVANADGTGTEERVVKMEKAFENDNGAVITSGQMDHYLADMPKEFSYSYDAEDFPPRKESRTYKFKYFVSEKDPSFKLDFRGSDKTVFTEDTVFVADYAIDDTGEYTTFWEFIQSIFARINVIFEYFSQIFGF